MIKEKIGEGEIESNSLIKKKNKQNSIFKKTKQKKTNKESQKHKQLNEIYWKKYNPENDIKKKKKK